MKKKSIVIALLVLFVTELGMLLILALQDTGSRQDPVTVNEALYSVQEDWGTLESHGNRTDLAYVVLDMEGEVLYRTAPGLTESIHQAVAHRDTILDVENDGLTVGKLIIYNDGAGILEKQKRRTILTMAAVMLAQWGICIGCMGYLHSTMVRPFHRLKDFARRVAGGNLDIPLEMDRGNLFGAFTESFDIMRSELKKARAAEAQANASKKELVAKLSHDIKTPVASIKAAAEVGEALAAEGRTKENYIRIIRKTDQINTLITNLFTATLEELEQLTVLSVDMGSGELTAMLESADYFHCAAIPPVPECLLRADRLRLQQVFDNIFANSYKYGRGAFHEEAFHEEAFHARDTFHGSKSFQEKTKIDVTVWRENHCLAVCIEDRGGGVPEEELPLLKEKFRRGSNALNMEGAGLGLYISDFFMKEMGGELLVENGMKGLRVTILICLSK